MKARARAVERFAPVDVILLVALSTMWGSSFLFMEISVDTVHPLWIVTVRTIAGGLALLAVLALRGRRLPSDPRLWAHLALLGTFNNAVPWAGVAWAQQFIPSGLAALLMALVPISTLLISFGVGLERFTVSRFAGLATALAGVAVIVGDDIDDTGRLVAILVVVGVTVMYAISAVYAKSVIAGRERPLELATGQILMAAVMTAPVAWLFAPLPVRAEVTAGIVAALLTLGVVGTGLAYLTFYTLIERVGATNSSLVTYLIPVVAIVLGALVLGERLGLAALAGGALVVAGIWLAQARQRPRPIEQFEQQPR